ncbi:MAG: FkbM family methyltransferase [Planctomycetes bacterium]|nr:FkbM family methyltransferase [Planctomycetota bacterium]
MIRRVTSMLPGFAREAVLRLAKSVRTRVFLVPDAFDDLVRISRLIKPVAVLDIGAHVGETVAELASRMPETPVYAFEPTPASLEQLRKRAAPLPRVTVHPVAIADHAGKISFFINEGSQTNSLLDNAEGNKKFLGGVTRHVGKIEVEATTLDAWAAKNVPTGDLVVKVDVQGAELQVIAGGREVLGSRVAVFYTEVSLTQLYQGKSNLFTIHEALTNGLPFVLYQIYRTRSNAAGQAMWADAMWVRADVLPRLG